jgi:hypothetical protein
MDPAKASALVHDPHTPLSTLKILARLGLLFLTEGAIIHPNATTSFIRELVPINLQAENDVSIACSITHNKITPSDVLERILFLIDCHHVDGSRREHWNYESLAFNTLVHPNCSSRAAIEFLDTHTLPRSFRASLAKTIESPEILERLNKDMSSTVRAVASEKLDKLHDL